MKRLRALADALGRWLTKTDYEDVFVKPPPRRSYCMRSHVFKGATVHCMRDHKHDGPHVGRDVSGCMDQTPPHTFQHYGVVHVVDWVQANPYYRRAGRSMRNIWTTCGLHFQTGSRHRRKEVTCVTCLVGRDAS